MRVKSWKRVTVATAVAGALAGTFVAQVGAAEPGGGADLRVDSDRDGRVDVSGESDEHGEDTWTARRGAVLLPNIDDDARRCRVRTGGGGRPSDAQLARCNDAADKVVNGEQDAKDLARLRTVPVPGASAGTRGTVRVLGGAARKTRLFIRRSGTWKPLGADGRLSAAELRSGAELGIEARDVVRDAEVWDGTVTLRLTVTGEGGTTRDDVTMKVAPVLTHHHLQRVQQVMVTKLKDEGDAYTTAQNRFVGQLAKQVRDAGISKPLRTFTGYGDIWAQDFVEPGYAGIPGPGGRMQTMRIMIRSAQPDREAGRELFEKLRGRDVGVVQVGGVRDSEEWTLNSMGNLETIPPYSHAGKEFPAGRIIQGQRADTGAKPAKAMRTFLASQGAQSPLLLDTSWLSVGHVDEFVQFLPARTDRGWRIAVADPEAGIALLRKAKQEGHGGTRMFSVPAAQGVPAPKETVGKVLSSKPFLADNKLAADRIRANLRVLQRETGVSDAEIVRVPALFTRDSGEGGDVSDSRKLRRMGPREMRRNDQLQGAEGERAAARTTQTSAYVPGAVNGIVLSDSRYLAPRQWGPVVGGKDVFTEAVNAAYRRAGFTTAYIDDWHTYHLGMGEVHCGTNTLRDPSSVWWTR